MPQALQDIDRDDAKTWRSVDFKNNPALCLDGVIYFARHIKNDYHLAAHSALLRSEKRCGLIYKLKLSHENVADLAARKGFRTRSPQQCFLIIIIVGVPDKVVGADR